MRKPSRRSLLAIPPCLCYLDRSQGAQEPSPTEAWPTPQVKWPREIAGIRVADSKFTKIAAEALLDSSPAFLVNHAMRTFFFGALIGRQQKLSFNGEVFFLACALHDLGLTTKYQGALPFEIQGAEAARRILSSAAGSSQARAFPIPRSIAELLESLGPLGINIAEEERDRRAADVKPKLQTPNRRPRQADETNSLSDSAKYLAVGKRSNSIIPARFPLDSTDSGRRPRRDRTPGAPGPGNSAGIGVCQPPRMQPPPPRPPSTASPASRN